MEEDVHLHKHVLMERVSSESDSGSDDDDIENSNPLDNTVLSENVDRFTTLMHKNEILVSNYNGEYKTLYEDSLRKLAEHTEKFQKRLIHLTTEYEELNEKYEEAIRSHESDKAEHQTMISNFEYAINEKDEIIASQNETINSYSGSECISHVRLKKNNDDIFRRKPKKKGNAKSIDVDALKCEYPKCEYNGNVDLIKCNACGKWVCEECNDIAVPKLKTIMNKCHALYFVCKCCDVMILDDSTMSRDLKPRMELRRRVHPKLKRWRTHIY